MIGAVAVRPAVSLHRPTGLAGGFCRRACLGLAATIVLRLGARRYLGAALWLGVLAGLIDLDVNWLLVIG